MSNVLFSLFALLAPYASASRYDQDYCKNTDNCLDVGFIPLLSGIGVFCLLVFIRRNEIHLLELGLYLVIGVTVTIWLNALTA